MPKRPNLLPGDPAVDQSGPSQLQLQEALAGQEQLRQQLSRLENQNVFLSQQLAELTQQMGQQLSALRESESGLRDELKRFQTGGPKQAMSAVFYKLFRELIAHLNQLDDLTRLGAEGLRSAEERSWIEAMEVLRDSFEGLLLAWGCAPVPATAFKDEFDPALHEAVAAMEDEIPAGTPPNIIVLVRQRGWQLHSTILQYPQVVIS